MEVHKIYYESGYCGSNNYQRRQLQKDGLFVMRKRVMVVVDNTSNSQNAMFWALNNVIKKGDLLTLLHIVSPNKGGRSDGDYSSPNYLVNFLGSLCKASRPEVEVETIVVQGPKLATVTSLVKKLDVSVLVLGQKRPSSFINWMCGTRSRSEDFVEQCISSLDKCFTVGVKKRSKSVGGYIINTKYMKNFWQLA